MSVYVDAAIHPWRGKKWCHLIADTEEELHAFAIGKLGLKRAWFQVKPEGIDHYDITESKRDVAIMHGAIPINRVTMCKKIDEARKRRGQEPFCDDAEMAKIEELLGDEQP